MENSQRQIKFRAWDKEQREGGGMLYSDKYPDLQCFFCLAYGQITEPKTNPLMQFTGLHDKNGKEIYEGDIVDTGTDKGMQVHIGGYLETVGGNGNGVHISNKNETRVFGVSPFNQDNAIEIIGDIYESPELLK